MIDFNVMKEDDFIRRIVVQMQFLEIIKFRDDGPNSRFAPLRRNPYICYDYDCRDYVHQNKRK